MGRLVGRAVVGIVGVALLATSTVALVRPRQVVTLYHPPVVVVTSLTLVVVAVLWRPAPVIRRCCQWRWTASLVTVLAGAVALVTGHSLRLPYSWDVRITLEIAARLHAGVPLTLYQQGYAVRYPNNTAMIAIDRVAYAVSEAAGWRVDVLLVTVAALGAAVSVWTVHRMILPVGGPVRAVAAQVVTIALVTASPWMAIPYTDVLALPFLSGGLLLAMTAMRRPHDRWALLLAVAAGSSVAVAAVIKTIPYVVAGAMLVTGLLAALAVRTDRGAARRWMAGTLAAVATIGVTAVAVTSASGAVLADVPTRPQASAPLLWWVANGMTKKAPGHPAGYGGFNAQMISAISGMTREEATQWSATWIRQQWASRGPVGTTRFYAAKAAWNWGDGMFWAWGEGQDGRPQRLSPGNGLVGVVRDIDRPNGRWYGLRSDVTQAVWLATLVVIGLGGVLTRRPRPEVLLLGLSVLGLMVFTLLFQGRSRYLFTFVPVIVSLAAMVHPQTSLIRARIPWRRRRLSGTRPRTGTPRS